MITVPCVGRERAAGVPAAWVHGQRVGVEAGVGCNAVDICRADGLIRSEASINTGDTVIIDWAELAALPDSESSAWYPGAELVQFRLGQTGSAGPLANPD